MTDESEKALSVEQRVNQIKKMNLSYDALVELVAALTFDESAELEVERLTLQINAVKRSLRALELSLKEGHGAVGELLLEGLADRENAVAKALLSMQKYQKTKHATHAAMQRVEKSPKNKALKEIEAKYQEVKHIMHLRGRSAQFAREMHVKYPIFDDIATINRLVAKLNKSNELIPKK